MDKNIQYEDKIISYNPIYQPCWISYLGAASGILKSLGKERDIVDVGGYTGYAFLMNVSKGSTCPSGPTAHKAWDVIIPATSILGFRTEVYEDNKCYPESKPINAEDKKRAMKLFTQVKKSIDENHPVILWGLIVPEYGIVKGYNGDNYLVSTYRYLSNRPDDPVKYDSLESPGGLRAIFFKEKVSEIVEKDDKEALQRAIRFADGKNITHEKYIAGPKAYDEWANVLENGTEKSVPYHGNSYNAVCYKDGKMLAYKFLQRLANKYAKRKHGKYLLKASEEYKCAFELMNDFTTIFPFAFHGDLSTEKRRKGAELLRKAKVHETAAIKHMKAAYKNWK